MVENWKNGKLEEWNGVNTYSEFLVKIRILKKK